MLERWRRDDLPVLRKKCGVATPERVYEVLSADPEGDGWVDAIFEGFPGGEGAPRENWLLFHCLEDELLAESEMTRSQRYQAFVDKVAQLGGTVGKVNPPGGRFYDQFTAQDFDMVGFNY